MPTPRVHVAAGIIRCQRHAIPHRHTTAPTDAPSHFPRSGSSFTYGTARFRRARADARRSRLSAQTHAGGPTRSYQFTVVRLRPRVGDVRHAGRVGVRPHPGTVVFDAPNAKCVPSEPAGMPTDPVDERTPGKFDLSDSVTLIVGVVILLGSLGLDAYGVWALPRELKLAIIGGAAFTIFGEKAWKAVQN
ncbi:hypothetical protein HRTV-28_gp43 [Halorubrum tailed virus 28]|uniref:Uncharacterized protein n=1 Tax=Halorubrum tailed virus 28 TaxID=2878009 RepID=A0AAE8Y0X4_9CAUD|nr:hypothetical protein M1M39_gp44 [Halorubrum tailed virus 28]UBF23481.1 hypothetical protein HRTV-28_gp43 [Halorubrum tailed virus 28]